MQFINFPGTTIRGDEGHPMFVIELYRRFIKWITDTSFDKGDFTNTEVSGTGEDAIIQLQELSDNSDDIPYTDPAKYTLSDVAKLEIDAGRGLLKTLGGLAQNYPFTVPGNYIYNILKIIVDGVAKLIGSGAIVDLEGYWKMDEAIWNGIPDEVIDSSTNTNDGRAVGGAQTVVGGKISRAGSFDGINDNISIPHNAGMDFETTDAFSFQCWVKCGAGGNRSLMSQQQVSGSIGINLQVLTAGTVRMNLIGSSGSLAVDSTNTITNDVYRHIVVTYNGNEDESGVKIYIDDSEETKSIVANALAGSIITTVPFRLADREALNQPYTGLMDEVAVWSRELSSSEVTDLYNLGAGLELTFFPTDIPTIENQTGLVFTVPLDSFIETATKPAGTGLKYQSSSDDGVTKKWWNGSAWVARTTTPIVPSGVTLNVGNLDSGNLASLQALDADTYIVSEIGGPPPAFDIEIDFSGLTTPCDTISIHCYYDGQPAHIVDVEIWNYISTSWITLGQIPDDPTLTITQYDFTITGTKTDYVDGGGNAKIRIYHSSSGNAADDMVIDYVNIEICREWYYANEANLASVVHTNIAALASSGTFKFLAFSASDGTATAELDNILVTSAQVYSTDDNLYIDTKDTSQISPANIIAWLTAIITSTLPANTDIKLLFSVNGRVSWLTWSGSVWVAPASAILRANATAITDAQTNFSSLPLGGKTLDVRVFPYTSDNSVTPEIDNIATTSDAGVSETGEYESNIYDSELLSLDWGTIEFDVTIPISTTLILTARASNDSGDMGVYSPALTNGQETNLTGRYIQFKAEFDCIGVLTPIINYVGFNLQSPGRQEIQT